MELRKDIDRVMERIRAFSSEQTKTGALIHIQSIAGLKTPPVAPLEQWDAEKDFRPLLDAQLDSFVAYWQQRAGIADDLLPAIAPYYGIAEHSAFVGGDVSFGGNTSYHHAFLHDYADLEGLTLDESNRWFRMLLDGMAYLKERAAGRCLLKLRGGECPMDIANAVRGNELFVDIYEDPDSLHALLRFCRRATRFMMDHQRAVADTIEGGMVCGYGPWLPGKSFGHLSEDASTLCSPAQYADFGLPYTREALRGYDVALMHTHALGRRTLPEIASLDTVGYIEIARDPNEPAPIDVLRAYEACLRGKIVVLTADLAEMEANLALLRAHKVILLYPATDLQDAERAVRFVREKL